MSAIGFMLPGMSTCKLPTTIAAILLAGCGTSPSHTEAPPLPEPETIEESGGGAPEGAQSEPIDSDAAETDPGLPPPEPQKTCTGLPRGTCEATVGCAWSTTDDCVFQ